MLENNSVGQNNRILSIYQLLLDGKKLSKKELALQYNVSDKTIQRDFSEIRNFLQDSRTDKILEFDKKQNVYVFKQSDQNYLLPEEVLAISKIILEARAIPKKEMHTILNKLASLVHTDNRDLIQSIIHNEKELYVELKQSKSVMSYIWKIAAAIHRKQEIKIYYKKELDSVAKMHHLQPVGLLFSELYFYLIAYQSKSEMDFPIIYRLDRITSMDTCSSHFKVERFEEGEFRKRVQFMYTGDLMHIKFYFKGASLQAVLDRLPTAKIMEQNEERGTLLSAEVYGLGIQMWLLSQGDAIEVVSPPSFRQSMKNKIEKMLAKYE